MTKPINLNQARKIRDRVKKKAQAAENSVKYGRTKAERQRDAAQEKLAQSRLSALKRADD